MAQERMDDWMEYAKELARAERELRIERWVFISIECKDEAGTPVRLHSYDLPRELHERYRWVVRWREAGCNAYIPKGKSIPIIVIMTNVPDCVPISTPHCQGCQPPKPKSPSLSGKNVSISNTSVQTTCSLMKIQMNSWYGSVKNCG